MTPAGAIAVPAWMQEEGARRILSALGARGTARFVGGCVRDAVLGLAVSDIDIATDIAPGEVMRLVAEAGLKAVPTGLAHGTVTAVFDHHPYEITTLRRDVETFGRHARVEFTDDWAADAARRDFTMNALYADADGTLYDPTGGLADLAQGRVRFVGAAARRIEEDALRILRFFRFHAHYGRVEPDCSGLDACAAAAAMVERLSGERIAQEMRKLLRARAAPPTVWLMQVRGVLAHVSPDLRDLARLQRLAAIERELGLADPMRRLAALLPPEPAAARRLADRLKLSGEERDRLHAMAAAPAAPAPARAARYRLGAAGFLDAVLLAGADGADWRAALAEVEGWTPPAFPLRGADLLALGLAPGPALGQLLDRLEAEWLAADFASGRDALLARAAALAGNP